MSWKKRSLIMLAVACLGLNGEMAWAADDTEKTLNLPGGKYLNQEMKLTSTKSFEIKDYDIIQWDDKGTDSNWKGLIDAAGANTYNCINQKIRHVF